MISTRIRKSPLTTGAWLSLLSVCGLLLASCGDDGAPPARKPFLTSLSPPVHVTHRGGPLVAPENTLESFETAVTVHGTDVLETDLRPTADGAVVLVHDTTVDRTTDGTGLVTELTLAELKSLDAAYWFDPDGDGTFPWRGQGLTIPTLEEAFEAFPEMRYSLEIKEWNATQMDEAVASIVFDHGMEDRVCWGSQDVATAERLRATWPEVCVYYPVEAGACFALAVLNGEDPLQDCDVYDVLYLLGGIVSAEVVGAAHAADIPVFAFTVNDPAQMTEFYSYGVDGIITDRPDLLREVIDAL